MTNFEIITKLIGPINAVGCSNVDDKRLKNLNDYIQVVDLMLDEIEHAAKDSVRQEASMKAIGKRANDYLGYVREKVAPSGYVLMPRALTEHVSAHSPIMDEEFSETVLIECPECGGYGVDVDYCAKCDDEGKFVLVVWISLRNIKKIYAAVVKHCARKS